jgi:hypothetical protein
MAQSLVVASNPPGSTPQHRQKAPNTVPIAVMRKNPPIAKKSSMKTHAMSKLSANLAFVPSFEFTKQDTTPFRVSISDFDADARDRPHMPLLLTWAKKNLLSNLYSTLYIPFHYIDFGFRIQSQSNEKYKIVNFGLTHNHFVLIWLTSAICGLNTFTEPIGSQIARQDFARRENGKILLQNESIAPSVRIQFQYAKWVIEKWQGGPFYPIRFLGKLENLKFLNDFCVE